MAVGLANAGRRRAAGLTLIEMLVSVAVMTILVALVVVAVRSARDAVEDQGALEDRRAALGMMLAWSADHGGVWLNAGVPASGDETDISDWDGSPVLRSYLTQYVTYRQVYWTDTGDDSMSWCGFYGLTMITDAAMWSGSPPAASYEGESRRFWREVGIEEVSFPSHKAVTVGTLDKYVVDDWWADPYALGFADGSAAWVGAERIAPLVEGFTGPPLPAMNTLDGHRGRDVLSR